jgi:hypothetical protein
LNRWQTITLAVLFLLLPAKILPGGVTHVQGFILPPETIRQDYNVPQKFSDRHIDSVIYHSETMNIPLHICFNLIHQESRYDSTAVSHVGCAGYLQLHPKYFTFADSYDNLRQGYKFLRQQFDRLGTWRKALTYYNSGGKMKSSEKYLNYILNENRP